VLERLSCALNKAYAGIAKEKLMEMSGCFCVPDSVEGGRSLYVSHLFSSWNNNHRFSYDILHMPLLNPHSAKKSSARLPSEGE
jgi:hypothetical protein